MQLITAELMSSEQKTAVTQTTHNSSTSQCISSHKVNLKAQRMCPHCRFFFKNMMYTYTKAFLNYMYTVRHTMKVYAEKKANK